jgi:transposase
MWMSNKSRGSAKIDILRQQGTCNPHPEAVRHELFQGREGGFFDACDLLQVKYEMVRLVEVEKESVTTAAAAFGFSRPAFYEAQSALRRAGLAGLIPHKRGPRTAHKLTAGIMEFVRECRATQPELRATQLAPLIEERFGVRVHPRSIERRLLSQKKLR